MKSIIITPENEAQLKELKAWARKSGLKLNTLSEEDREDLGLARAVQAGRKSKPVSKDTVLSTLL